VKAVEHMWDMLALRRALAGLRPDVIHFQWTVIPAVDQYFVRRMRAIAPCVLTVHDTNAFLNPTSRLQKKGWQRNLKSFDKLIVHTQSGKQDLVAKGIEESSISVIPHGVFCHAQEDGQFKEDNSTLGNFTLLAFGSIRPYKGTDVLIRALGELEDCVRQKIRLVIAGDPGSRESELRELAAERGVADSIEWILRFVDDDEVAPLFRRCDAVVFPYREIDASGALMTALPFAKAIVASRLGLFGELLEDGKTALLVEPNDATALARALTTLVKDPAAANEMGRRAASIAKEVCGWDRIAEMTLGEYQSILCGKIACEPTFLQRSYTSTLGDHTVLCEGISLQGMALCHVSTRAI
jgi:glycosyltransferase involved in cell wall biosynthesis